jgi:hypothetical protein
VQKDKGMEEAITAAHRGNTQVSGCIPLCVIAHVMFVAHAPLPTCQAEAGAASKAASSASANMLRGDMATDDVVDATQQVHLSANNRRVQPVGDGLLVL